LITSCYAEYPGCVLDVEHESPELKAIASYHAGKGGRFWVAEREGWVVASAGLLPADGGGIELKKLYVIDSARRSGLGGRLCELVESEAHSLGAGYVELWSDTRFKEAHRLYERRGYVRGPQTREFQDLSATVEYYFRKEL